MMMAGPSFLLLLLMSGQTGVPLGLPPAPEDPVMAAVAPQECLWYFTWSGVATPDPKSTNQTEQLLAEPEVRDFINGVGKALSAAIRKGAPPTPQGKLLGAEGPGLIHALLANPTAAFISKAGIGPTGLDIAGGIVVGTGDETDKVKSTLEKLEKTLLGASAAAAKWHKLPSPPGAPTLEWGFHGKYLIVGIGDGSADAIVARSEGKPPQWLSAIKKKLAVERVSTVHYLNVKKAIAAAAAVPGFAQVQTVLNVLGLGNVQQFANVAGLEGTGCVSKSWVQIDGEPTGLFALVGPEPLAAADLAPIPKDASFAVAARMKPDQLWAYISEAVSKIDARSGEQFDAGIKQAEAMLGFRFKEDLFQTLGDSWCIYNSPSEGGLIITGLTVVVPVKDHDRLAKTNDQLVAFMRKSLAQEAAAQTNPFARRMSNTIGETTFQKQKIFYLNLFGGEMPFVLSWCVADKQLILSLSPQNIRAFLSRDPAAGSLADLPDVAAKIKADSPLVLTYQDTAGTLKITYPLLQMFASMGFSEMRREGIDLDGAVLPSLGSMIRHVEPGTSTLSREKDGLVYVSRQTMPVDLTLSGLLPAWSGMMFMSVREVRSAQVQMEEGRAIQAESGQIETKSTEKKRATPEEDAETKEEHARPTRPVQKIR